MSAAPKTAAPAAPSELLMRFPNPEAHIIGEVRRMSDGCYTATRVHEISGEVLSGVYFYATEQAARGKARELAGLVKGGGHD